MLPTTIGTHLSFLGLIAPGLRMLGSLQGQSCDLVPEMSVFAGKMLGLLLQL